MGKPAVYLTLGLLVLTMTACSAQLNRADAEAKLTDVHEECLSTSLKSEIPEFEFSFTSTSSMVIYRHEYAADKNFVSCVSTKLFGSDVTASVHSREDKLLFEENGGNAGGLLNNFRSQVAAKWEEPFEFARIDETRQLYYFYWMPSE